MVSRDDVGVKTGEGHDTRYSKRQILRLAVADEDYVRRLSSSARRSGLGLRRDVAWSGCSAAACPRRTRPCALLVASKPTKYQVRATALRLGAVKVRARAHETRRWSRFSLRFEGGGSPSAILALRQDGAHDVARAVRQFGARDLRSPYEAPRGAGLPLLPAPAGPCCRRLRG